MAISHRRNSTMICTLLGIVLLAGPALADDRADLRAMLHDFLAGVDRAEVHDRFWAEDLVYTSSRGTRTDKAQIMRGFDDAAGDAAAGPVYAAEDIRIKVYGTAAVVAFRLVATPAAGAPAEATVQQYFNTGTFLQRDGRWQVVAWQATRIPAP